MCKILGRIKEIITQEGITIASMERTIGASKGVLYKAISNGTDIQSKWLEAIVENYPLYSPSWLLTGHGSMLKTDVAEARPSISGSPIDEQLPDNTGIPLIPFDAMAGFLTGEMSVNESECERIFIPGLKADFVIPVSGNSMEPRYFSGDYVACQYVSISDRFFQWGRVFVIDTTQGVLIKIVRRNPQYKDEVLLVSENSNYDPISMPLSDIYHIALVKGLIRIE